MRRAGYILVAFATLALALSPVTADARAGDGGSFGSRGSRTYSAPPATATSPYAAPMQRSMTQPPPPSYGAPAAPAYGGAPGFGRPAFGGGGFMSGLMGGLIGAGIGGMLFGHGMFGGIGGFSSIIGLLIQIALVVFVVRWLFRRFAGPSTGVPFVAGVGRMPQAMPTGMTAGGGGGNPGPALSQGDFAAFEQNLQAIQAAWSTQDLNALRRLVTPEMLSYFNDQLAEQASRGVRNEVSDVRLLKGDLSEGWVENGKQYATVAMKFSMVDVTRDGTGHIVDGSLTEHVTATEFWTFMRVSGGNWVLSAIQQGR